jgi:[ribosomal protein S5]-alanine N-acetyltransferase
MVLIQLFTFNMATIAPTNEIDLQRFPELTTKRLLLRQLSEDDVQEIFALRSNEQINKYIDREKQTDLLEARAFIKTINERIDQHKCLYWAVCLRNYKKLIGTICVWNFNPDETVAEIGYEMLPNHQGLGLTTEAVDCIVRFAFLHLALKTLLAFTHVENLPSQRLLQKNHFKNDVLRKDETNQNIIVLSLQAKDLII